MGTVTIHKAKIRLEDSAADQDEAPRRLGFLAGEISVPEDFNRMSEVEIADLFEIGARESSF